MSRRVHAILLVALATALFAAPILAQEVEYVSASNADFTWTGKQERTANFSWSATIENASKRRDVEVRVTLSLLDEAGATVATDSTTTTLQNESSVEVSQDGSLPYDDAARVAQYVVSVEPTS